MKRGWVWVALLLSLGMNIGVLATLGVSRARSQARWHRAPEPGDRPPPFERLAKHLDLEGDQRERFMEIQRRLFRNTRQHQESLERLRAELRREIMSDGPDPARIEEFLDRIGAIHVAGDREMVESVLATRELLTPEQQRRYFRVLERVRDGGRRGGRMESPAAGRRPPPRERP